MTERAGRRAAQADATRREIVGAARRLFADRGYTATTIRDIANEAGVSVQTVYDSVGSKIKLVEALNDLIDDVAGVDALVAHALAANDVDAFVRLSPRVMCAIVEHAGDIVRLAVGAAGAEASLQQVRTEGMARHRQGAAMTIGALRARGVVREDLTDEGAAELLAALTDAEFGLLLRDRYGWSFERIEEFVTELVREQLLDGRQRRRRSVR